MIAELSHLREGGQMTPDLVFRDPYMLDFWACPTATASATWRAPSCVRWSAFAGAGGRFTFVARQKRISVGADDFYLDLLFYHRHLRRLVAVELNAGEVFPCAQGADGAVLALAGWNDR